MSWRKSICRPSYTPSLSAVADCICAFSPAKLSPIDCFYASSTELIKAGSPKLIGAHPPMGALLAIGAISAVELYVRQITGFALSICPIARKLAKEKMISVGSVFWHKSDMPEMAILEHLSFAGQDEIKKLLENYVGFPVSKESMTKNALLLFDQFCELRHNIVHSDRIVAGKNAIALSIPKTAIGMIIEVDYAMFQQVMSVCTALVTSINIELFELMVRRWAVEWPKHTPVPARERLEQFQKIWGAFYSDQDGRDGSITNPMTLSRCLLAVIREYRIAL